MHHGIATAIASDFLNRRRNREEFPQRKANLAIFHRKMHRNRNRIVTAEKSQPISQKESLRTVSPRKRIADFDRESSPGDGALRSRKIAPNFPQILPLNLPAKDQWNPKYCCRGTVTAHFALITFVAWKRLADSTLGKLLVHPEYG